MDQVLNKKFVVALLGVVTLCACGDGKNLEDVADIVFSNARVYTVDAEKPWAEAVAVKDSEIVYVGDAAGVEAYIGDATAHRDLNGQLLLPGFIDSRALLGLWW